MGETIFDIIFKDGQPIGGYPGGSTFNAIISLGRSGVNTAFISETGDDRVGRQIVEFLEDNGVNTSGVTMYPDTKSPISLAFLNEHNDAEYIFYKDQEHDRPDFTVPEIHKDDILLFGSYYAVDPKIRPLVAEVLEMARKNGAIIYYDINFRASYESEIMRLTPNILENLEYADVVRGSFDDFNILYRLQDPDSIYQKQISFYCKKFIYTKGAQPVELRAENGIRKSYPPKKAAVVSTIGAGDNFNAGFIYGLIKHHITRETIEQGLSEEQWDKIMGCAGEFSSESCKSIYNYVSKDFGAQKKAALSL